MIEIHNFSNALLYDVILPGRLINTRNIGALEFVAHFSIRSYLD